MKSVNTTTWRCEKELLGRAEILDNYERLWRREITKYENERASAQEKKLRHLRNKYKKKKETIPDEIEGIILKGKSTLEKVFLYFLISNRSSEIMKVSKRKCVKILNVY